MNATPLIDVPEFVARIIGLFPAIASGTATFSSRNHHQLPSSAQLSPDRPFIGFLGCDAQMQQRVFILQSASAARFERTANQIYTERVKNANIKPHSESMIEPVGSLINAPVGRYIHYLQAYVQWTMQVWSTTDRPMSMHDLLVMTSGLAGEMGELLEQHAFVGTCKEDPRELQLEFGDVLYYWARIIHHFDVDVVSVMAVSRDASFLPAGHARLPISISKVSEAIKKFVRNDHKRMTESRHQALTEGLGLVWQDWSAMIDFHGLELIEVIAANHAKLYQRHARQVSKRNHAIAHAEAAAAASRVIEDDTESIPFTGAMSQ